MALNDVLKEAAMADINECASVYLGPRSLKNYFDWNRPTIKFLYDNGVLTNKELDSVLENKVVAEVRKYIRMMNTSRCFTNVDEKIKDHTYADDVFHTELLAYALQKNLLSKRELVGIKFNGDDPKSFVKQYGRPGLIKTIREVFLNPKPSMLTKSSSSNAREYHNIDAEHPSCDCGN
ncbi:MAG: hypothetical protein ACP5NW_05905 [Candidatus Woesearchaeota archaeon]